MRTVRTASTEELPDGRLVRNPKIVVCCKSEFALDAFTNTCPECGADFNMNGSRLAPREMWGEETGEHWSDIINL